MKITKKMHADAVTPKVFKEHPDDKAMRETAQKGAAKIIEAFFAANSERFKALVGSYFDAQAEDLLQQLREEFWSTDFKGTK
jgi:hypothetical protein